MSTDKNADTAVQVQRVDSSLADISENMAVFTKKPEHFSGEDPDSFPEWLEMFDVVSTMNKWDEARKLLVLPSYLTHYAFQVYQGLVADEKADYATLVKSLKTKIIPKDRAMLLEMEFGTLKRKSGESIDSFLYKIRRMAKRAFPDKSVEDRNVAVRKQFILGQDRDLQFQLLQVPSEKDLDHIILTAKTYEAASLVARVRTIHLAEETTEAPDRNIAMVVKSDAVNPRTNGRDSSSPTVCYRCGEDGHFARVCPTRAQKQGLLCYECNQPDHIARFCPRRTQMRQWSAIPGSNGRNEIVCYKCFQKGHLQRDCRSGNSGQNCQRCGHFGHDAAVCRTDISLQCERCHKKGHESRFCRIAGAVGGVVHNVVESRAGGQFESLEETERARLSSKNDAVPAQRGDTWDQDM